MIEIESISKHFDDTAALSQVSFRIPEGKVFGLLGTNGAGKSTLLRVMAGILKADAGTVRINGEVAYENPGAKERFFYLPDDPYYFPTATMEDMARFYKKQYSAMDRNGARYMADRLELDIRRPIRTFSKGMKRQAFLIMALCANTDYLLCDEVFDGLDPVVTEAMKNLFGKEIHERALTVVVAAHKLQDLEDFCNEIGILHKGGLLLAGDMRDKAGTMTKIQWVFEQDEPLMAEHPAIVRCHRDGYFTTVIVRGKKEEALENIRQRNPIFCREVPMLLEEIFMAEMEENGYDIRKVLQ